MNKQSSIKRQDAFEEVRLTPEQVLEVFELLKHSNSLELKVMVPDSTLRGTVDRLGFDMVMAEPRITYFFDTADLALNKAVLIVRARRRSNGKADTTVKLRPVDPAQFDDSLREDPDFKIEVDVMPGGYVCSASCKGTSTAQDVLDAAEGRLPLKKLFSGKQREFYAAHAPAGLKMGKLVPLGPTFLLRAKQQPKGFDRPMTVELWFYPDGTRLFELSTKGEPDQAFQVGTQFKAFLAQSGIDLQKGATKTGSSLRFFAKEFVD